jgi:antitoxin component of MazEF toxin-antitoxin module
MEVTLSKRGSGIGLLLPNPLVQQLGLCAGQNVKVTPTGNRLIIETAGPAYRLEDLLVNITPQAMSACFDWGDEKGREVANGQ